MGVCGCVLLTYFRSPRQRTVHGCCRRARRPPCRRCCRPGPESTAATSMAHRRSSSPSLTDTPTSPGPLHSTQLDIPRSELIAKFHYTDPTGPDRTIHSPRTLFVIWLNSTTWARPDPARTRTTRISEKLRWSVRVSDKVRAGPRGSGRARVVEFSL